MRAATIALIGVLIAPVAVRTQADSATEFSVTGFFLPLTIPDHAPPNLDGSPGLAFWLAIKNRTSIPYSLRTAGTGWSTDQGGYVGGVDHSPYWIVLPGETYFQAVGGAVPKDLDTPLRLSVSLQGKPLGALGDVQQWRLSWTGTVQQAIGLGEQMRAKVP